MSDDEWGFAKTRPARLRNEQFEIRIDLFGLQPRNFGLAGVGVQFSFPEPVHQRLPIPKRGISAKLLAPLWRSRQLLYCNAKMSGIPRHDRIGESMMVAGNFDHEQLSSAGLRAFWKIATLWHLTDQEQMKLLGLCSESTLRRWRAGQVKHVGRDTLERISYVLGIYKAIHTLLPSQERANAWIRRPNKAPFLNGSSALDRLAAGNVGDLYVVRQYLDAELAR